MTTENPEDEKEEALALRLREQTGDRSLRTRQGMRPIELDRSAAKLLPALVPGEALFVGVDFPVRVAVKIPRPIHEPESEGPKYATGWKLAG